VSVRKVRYYLYLKDVLLLSLTSFGGPQAFLAMVLETMVRKRGYIREQELWELNALCQILPGPTSTQTISAIGYRIGGANFGLPFAFCVDLARNAHHDRGGFFD
jgi:chromate transporter